MSAYISDCICDYDVEGKGERISDALSAIATQCEQTAVRCENDAAELRLAASRFRVMRDAQSQPAAATAEPTRGTKSRKKEQPTGFEPVASNGAAAAAAEGRTNPPSSAPPASAAAPAGLVDRKRLLQMLDEATEDWPEVANGNSIIASWSEAQCKAAYVWAEAVLNDGPFAIQSQRPGHTLMGRQPGDEG